MNSFKSYIAGTDVTPDSWIYTIRASAYLDDFLKNLKLKRGLEKGAIPCENLPLSVVGRCGVTTDEQLDSALKQAKSAAPRWASFSMDTRLEVARLFHEEVKLRRKEIVDVFVSEGHPQKLAQWEVSGILQCSSPESLGLWRQQLKEEKTIGKRRLLLVRKPDGVVTLSPPQNAAASNSIGGLSVLVAGNALVVKAPHSCAYGVMFMWREIIAPILEKVGAPDGTLSIVCGKSSRIIKQWLDSPLVDDIFYFGGSERGIQLGIEAVQKGKKPILELAGNDGCVVWSDAHLDRAAEALVECFYGSGQICMVPKFAIVHPYVADALIERLKLLISDIQPGMPEDENALLSPVLRVDDYQKVLAESLAHGAEVLTGGYRVELDGSQSDTGPFIAPTLLKISGLEHARELSSVREETFFPMLPLIVPKSNHLHLLDEVIDFLNANQFGLRNSFWTESESVIEKIIIKVNNGGLLKINDSHIGFTPWLATHGGTGLTGGPFGELNYPLVRTSRLQGISIATGINPSEAVFESPCVEVDTESEYFVTEAGVV